jgi:hypothetical protein
MEYDPRRGYQLLERAALENGSREAAAFLVAHQQEARVWGIPERRLAMLSQGED